jgi:hypothetical protein
MDVYDLRGTHEWRLGVVKILFGSSEEVSYILLFKNNICRQSLTRGCVHWHNEC